MVVSITAPVRTLIKTWLYVTPPGYSSREFLENIYLYGTNDAPVLAVSALSSLTTKKNTPLSYTVPVTDPEGLAFTSTLAMQDGSNLPSFISFTSANLSFYINPTLFSHAGTYPMSVTFTDNYNPGV